MNWYEKQAQKMGYKECRDCVYPLAPLRGCERLERGGDGVLRMICPRWIKKENK